MRITFKRAASALAILVVVAVIYWWPSYGSEAKNFPGGLAFSDRVSTMTGGRNLSAHEGKVFSPKPIPTLPKPLHPIQSNIGYAGAHGDSYNSGVMPQAAPLGNQLVVHSRITALDFETGEMAWRHYIGSGKQWDNAMLTASIGPDGLLTSGMFGGIMSIRDTN